ncbi:MAG: flagellar brake protein [Comamonas sp.]
MSEAFDEQDPSGSPYALTSPAEIIGVLRDIARSRALLQLWVPPSVVSVVTALLHADANGLVLDHPGEALMRRIDLSDGQVVLETALDQIQVRLLLAGIERHVHEGRPALRSPLPVQVLRVQRRDVFRVHVSAVNPVLCRVTVDGREAVLPLDDIGVGGVGLFDDGGVLAQAKGAVLRGCRLELPGVGPVSVDLRVVQAREIVLPQGKVRHRLGCAYDGEGQGRALQLIQRYVSQLEREAIARRRGLA